MRSNHGLALGAVMLLLVATARTFAAAETITGRLVDLACYTLDKSNTGATHAGRGYACAQACAKEGFQVALLTDDGKLVQVAGGLVANKNAKLVPHLGNKVTILGEINQKDGMATITANELRPLAASNSGR